MIIDYFVCFEVFYDVCGCFEQFLTDLEHPRTLSPCEISQYQLLVNLNSSWELERNGSSPFKGQVLVTLGNLART